MSSTGGVGRCPYCGGYHMGMCPMIEEIEYYPNGMVKRVKLREESVDYGPQVNVTWHPLPEISQDV